MPENDDLKNTFEKSTPAVPAKMGHLSASRAKPGLGLLKSRTDRKPQSLVVQEKKHKVGDTMKVTLPGGFEMVFCYIPAGEFRMGSPEHENERMDCEGPAHRVVISQPFWMGKFQVSQNQWRYIAERLPKAGIDLDASPSRFKGERLPVEQVSWNDCQEFLARLNAKGDGNVHALPTEAEWEYACRAGTTTPFSWGETITPEQVNFDGTYQYGDAAEGLKREKTIPVGSLNRPNPWGLHDMHGNVWEWCADWFHEGYYQNSPMNDPRGPEFGEERILRGGSWGGIPEYCRSATRGRDAPSARCFDTGLRVVVHFSRK
jgi:formylglycine-generating enzyme required for sulfatase activity